MPKSYHLYFGYCLLLFSEAEMPSEKRRIQERERETTKGGSKEEHITTGLATKKPNSRWHRDFAIKIILCRLIDKLIRLIF